MAVYAMFVTGALLWPGEAFGRRLTAEEALKRAGAALAPSPSTALRPMSATIPGASASGMKLLYTSSVTGPEQEPVFYVFGYPESRDGDGGGFVIASADDRLRPVLANVRGAIFDPDAIPANMAWWLSEYEREAASVFSAEAGEASGTSAGAILENYSHWTSIPTLLSTTWNQGKPYNGDAPAVNGNQCVTGCVATAMAQIVRHHHITPPTGNGVASYTTTTYKLPVSYDFNNPSFDWDNMLDSYDDSYTSDQGRAVANLMKACGVAVNMDYSPSASGAPSVLVPTALNQYFGFDRSSSLVTRADYNTAEWEELIYHELSNSRPVFYSGGSNSGGHAFVCDGYSSDGLFHINWGWGSYCDGFFALSVLNPSGQGIGGSAGGYNNGQQAALCIPPTAQDKPSYSDYVLKLLDNFKLNSSSGTTDAFTVSATLSKSLQSPLNYRHGVVFEKSDGTTIKKECPGSNIELKTNWSYECNIRVTDINLSPGIYTVRPIAFFNDVDGSPVELVFEGGAYQNELILTVSADGTRTYTQAEMPRARLEVIEFKQLNEFYNGSTDNAFSFTLYNSGEREFNSGVEYYLDGTALLGRVNLIIPPGQNQTVKTQFAVPSALEGLTGECTLTLREYAGASEPESDSGYPTVNYSKIVVNMHDGTRTSDTPIAPTYVAFRYETIYITLENGNLMIPFAVRSTEGKSQVEAYFRLFKHGTDKNYTISSRYWNLYVTERGVLQETMTETPEPGLYDLVAYNHDNNEQISERITLSIGGISDDFSFFHKIDGSSAMISSYTGSNERIIVPETVAGMPVTAIADKAFSGNKTVKTLELPASVSAIGLDALRMTSSLEALLVNSTTPIEMGHPSTVMYGTNPNLAIYVPEEAYAGYKAAPVARFFNIYKRITALKTESDKAEIDEGGSVTLAVTTTPAEGVNPGLTLTVENPAIAEASIADGVVTIKGIARGTTTVNVVSAQPGLDPAAITVIVGDSSDPYDINSDGDVNIFDVTYLVDLIVTDTASPAKHDINGDGSVNIFDITHLVRYIAGGSITRNLSGRSGLLREIGIETGYDGACIAVQADLRVDGEGSIRDISLNPAVSSTHICTYGQTADGVVRVMVYSPVNAVMELPRGENLFILSIDDNADISIDDAIYVTSDRTIHHATPTGVKCVAAEREPVSTEYFDLGGHRIEQPSSGIFVRRIRYADGLTTTEKVVY